MVFAVILVAAPASLPASAPASLALAAGVEVPDLSRLLAPCQAPAAALGGWDPVVGLWALVELLQANLAQVIAVLAVVLAANQDRLIHRWRGGSGGQGAPGRRRSPPSPRTPPGRKSDVEGKSRRAGL